MPAQTYILTSVTVPPVSRDLTDLDTVKDDWRITGNDNDAFLRRSITRCSVAAANYCNREFGIATYVNVVHLQAGYRDNYLALGKCNPVMMPQWPIAAVASITLTNSNQAVTSLTEGEDYEVKYDSGMLYRLDRYRRPTDWAPTDVMTVTLTAGYVLPGQSNAGLPATAQALPPDISDAVGRMVWVRYAERGRDPFVKAEEVAGISRTEYIVGNPMGGDGGNLAPDIMDLLNNYRQLQIG